MAIYIPVLLELLFMHIVFIYLELQYCFGAISCWEVCLLLNTMELDSTGSLVVLKAKRRVDRGNPTQLTKELLLHKH